MNNKNVVVTGSQKYADHRNTKRKKELRRKKKIAGLGKIS